MKAVGQYKDRKQIAVRLQHEDHDELKLKAYRNNLSVQSIFEVLIKKYLSGDKYLVELVAPYKNYKAKAKPRGTLSDRDQNYVMDQCDDQSPLQDLVIADDPFDKD